MSADYLLHDGDEDKCHKYCRMAKEVFLPFEFGFSKMEKYQLAKSNFSKAKIDFNYKVSDVM